MLKSITKGIAINCSAFDAHMFLVNPRNWITFSGECINSVKLSFDGYWKISLRDRSVKVRVATATEYGIEEYKLIDEYGHSIFLTIRIAISKSCTYFIISYTPEDEGSIYNNYRFPRRCLLLLKKQLEASWFKDQGLTHVSNG